MRGMLASSAFVFEIQLTSEALLTGSNVLPTRQTLRHVPSQAKAATGAGFRHAPRQTLE